MIPIHLALNICKITKSYLTGSIIRFDSIERRRNYFFLNQLLINTR